MTLVIRKALAEDAAIMAQIVTLARRAHYTAFLLPQDLADGGGAVESVEKWRKRLRDGRDDGCIEFAFLAEVDGEPAGQASVLLDLPRYGPGVAEVSSFFGHPSHGRKGVGAALFEKLKATARDRGQTRLVLYALADNKIGRAFYEKMGGRLNGDVDRDDWCGRSYDTVYYEWSL